MNKSKIKIYGPEDANMELLNIQADLKMNAMIASSDDVGNMKWLNITNVTRHDPSEYIYDIKTKWGRNVSVVASKSLIVWNNEMKIFEERNTEDVQLGDKLPVTVNIPAYDKKLDYVDVRRYLPDNKYIYGTDYNKGKKKTKKFEILDNHVYLKCARRNSIPIEDKFELNRENGFFIGIYLAEGNTGKEYVSIANNDKNIRDKVQAWFEKRGIVHSTQVKKENPDRPGLSISIRGYSTILAQFIDKFVGRYSHGKYVPYEAYNAPDEFIEGLIDGYMSGDACVTDYHVVVSSVSQDLILGVNTLLSRYGIFGKMWKIQQKKNNVGSKNILPRYNLSIQSKYVHMYGKIFTFTLKEKQVKLDTLLKRETLTNMSFLYEQHNDVILDEIVSIDKIKSQNQKVYDITVPTTLNFQIFNGLNIRDTSETGYIQRKLVKAMEDCKINYDYTVRNASGSIIQFLYGEDGMDASKLENQLLTYIEHDFNKLKNEYLLTKEDTLKYYLDDKTIQEFQSKDWELTLKEHFDQVLRDREFIIQKIFDNKKETNVLYPISFLRIIQNAKAIFKDRGMSDLNPLDVLKTIESLPDELYVSKMNPGNKLLLMLMRCYLSPKKVIFEHKFNQASFDYIIQQIKLKYYDAIAHPSEMVGVIAAQSIGEP